MEQYDAYLNKVKSQLRDVQDSVSSHTKDIQATRDRVARLSGNALSKAANRSQIRELNDMNDAVMEARMYACRDEGGIGLQMRDLASVKREIEDTGEAFEPAYRRMLESKLQDKRGAFRSAVAQISETREQIEELSANKLSKAANRGKLSALKEQLTRHEERRGNTLDAEQRAMASLANFNVMIAQVNADLAKAQDRPDLDTPDSEVGHEGIDADGPAQQL